MKVPTRPEMQITAWTLTRAKSCSQKLRRAAVPQHAAAYVRMCGVRHPCGPSGLRLQYPKRDLCQTTKSRQFER